MTPQEKDLIQGVFDRLARNSVGQKDAEADALIRDNLRRQPDGVYALVQTVVVQEMGLNQATAQINELQRQLDEARVASQGHPSGAGFLPSGPSPWGGGSVPRSGQGYAPPPPPMAPPQQQGPWAQPAGPAPAPAYAPQPQAAAQPQQPSAVGGFLRNAATMAAGVAGGALIAQGLSSMFGGHHFGGGYGGGFGGGFGGGGPWGGGNTENVTVNNYYGDQSDQGTADRDNNYRDASYDGSQDNGYQDASYDDGGVDDGGGFDDSSDV